jgi:predicted Zn-dependent protease
MRSEPSETYPGRYYDGESAAAHEIVVRCSTTVLVVSAGSDVLATWSYSELHSPDPLISGRPARLSHSSAPYARLVVEDPGFSECVLDRAPHLSSSAHRRRGLKIVVACMLLAVCVVAAGYAFLTFAPATFAKMIPDAWRHNLGEQVKQLLVNEDKQCTDPKGVAALDAMTKRLSASEDDPGQFKVFVYDLSIVNAFALPGGTIVISRQLVEAASGADGVAGVLAHEMGHVIERDSEAQLIRNLGISFLQQVLFGSGAIGDSVGGVAGLLTLMRYTREAERQADRHAIRIMEAGGVSLTGLISFFEFIKDKYGGKSDDDGDLLSLFNSHPGVDERIENLKQTEEWPATPVLSDAQWTALTSVCANLPAAKKENDSEAVEN